MYQQELRVGVEIFAIPHDKSDVGTEGNYNLNMQAVRSESQQRALDLIYWVTNLFHIRTYA